MENLKKVDDLDSLTFAQLTLHIESKDHEYPKKVLHGNSDLLDLRFYLLMVSGIQNLKILKQLLHICERTLNHIY